ncbi:MAG: lysophospholipid acyltransferase family protein [Planctomycetaceae bacterium]|jgi:lysophospholipid acyltransferase (LPLAT)-like uncharacterized protein|nr:lysophospholipid acyltransferase family protein [Planctomycetaceae bacterium]
MNYFQSLLLRGGGLMMSTVVHHWMGTLDYKAAYYDQSVDPAYPEGNRRKRLYIFWHEYILFMLFLRRRCHLAMLLSRHRDADVLEQIASIFGFETVRGSSSRGGVAAIREMMQKAKDYHLTITPDGPRGPRRKLAPGAIFLASKLQIPLVLLGLGYDRPFRVPTWDKFAVPRLFSRARAIVSPEIFVPPKLTSEMLQQISASIETAMNQLCDCAENWAASGDLFLGESQMTSGPLNDFNNTITLKQAVIKNISLN